MYHFPHLLRFTRQSPPIGQFVPGLVPPPLMQKSVWTGQPWSACPPLGPSGHCSSTGGKAFQSKCDILRVWGRDFKFPKLFFVLFSHHFNFVKIGTLFILLTKFCSTTTMAWGGDGQRTFSKSFLSMG